MTENADAPSGAIPGGCGWADLVRELDTWHAAGRCATFWWRDDDAMTTGPTLDRLVALHRDTAVPLALAVVPAQADPRLSAELAAYPEISVLQHGYDHANHATPGDKKSEIGDGRIADEVARQLGDGRDTLRALFADKALPVLVPPWNRIGDAALKALPGLGFVGLSRYKARSREVVGPGIRQVNCHVDIVDWRGTRGFIGEYRALDLVVGHLSARRRGECDADEPTGLLTHHRVLDEAGWDFAAAFLRRTAAHAAAAWLDAHQLFGKDGR
jgi:hypothetical protein